MVDPKAHDPPTVLLEQIVLRLAQNAGEIHRATLGPRAPEPIGSASLPVDVVGIGRAVVGQQVALEAHPFPG